MQDLPHVKPPPPPPQVDIRDGSLASLLNSDVQLPSPSAISYDQSQLIPAMDFSLDFVDMAPIDSVLKESNMVDWARLAPTPLKISLLILSQTLIDHILLERPESTYRPTAL